MSITTLNPYYFRLFLFSAIPIASQAESNCDGIHVLFLHSSALLCAPRAQLHSRHRCHQKENQPSSGCFSSDNMGLSDLDHCEGGLFGIYRLWFLFRCIALSFIAGIPSGRNLPLNFGIYTRRKGSGRYPRCCKDGIA